MEQRDAANAKAKDSQDRLRAAELEIASPRSQVDETVRRSRKDREANEMANDTNRSCLTGSTDSRRRTRILSPRFRRRAAVPRLLLFRLIIARSRSTSKGRFRSGTGMMTRSLSRVLETSGD
jgi:hypothetical protein